MSLESPDGLVQERCLAHAALALKHDVLSRFNEARQLFQKVGPWTKVLGADYSSILERIHGASIVVLIGITPYGTMSIGFANDTGNGENGF
jgi:hypothetical protein